MMIPVWLRRALLLAEQYVIVANQFGWLTATTSPSALMAEGDTRPTFAWAKRI